MEKETLDEKIEILQKKAEKENLEIEKRETLKEEAERIKNETAYEDEDLEKEFDFDLKLNTLSDSIKDSRNEPVISIGQVAEMFKECWNSEDIKSLVKELLNLL